MTSPSNEQDLVLIAGGGIVGLTMALTLHQIGVRCKVFEAVPELLQLATQRTSVRTIWRFQIRTEITPSAPGQGPCDALISGLLRDTLPSFNRV